MFDTAEQTNVEGVYDCSEVIKQVGFDGLDLPFTAEANLENT